MDIEGSSNHFLEKRIAGEIALSGNPGAAMNKWRAIFKVPQHLLAEQMRVMPSVISDYESGRRKSPGVAMIKKFVDALIAVDENAKNPVSAEFNSIESAAHLSDAIIDARELKSSPTLSDIASAVRGAVIVGEDDMRKSISGYIIIDSLKAIVEFSPKEFPRLRGMTTNKAVVFTGIEHGKSALVAIKAANIKPGAVILHGVKGLDKLAERIARTEGIPVIISDMSTVDELAASLKTVA